MDALIDHLDSLFSSNGLFTFLGNSGVSLKGAQYTEEQVETEMNKWFSEQAKESSSRPKTWWTELQVCGANDNFVAKVLARPESVQEPVTLDGGDTY